MKYNIVFKFLAVALCALMLLGAAGSAAAIIGMTESGLYDISVEELRDRYIRSAGESMAARIAVDYAEANLGGVPEAIAGPTVYDLGPSGKTGWLYGVFNPALAGYVLKDAEGNVLESGGAETEILFLGSGPVRDCTACRTCQKTPGRCVFDDDMVNPIIEKAREADGFVFGTPVYYAHPSGRILSVLDRVFYAGKDAFAHKPGAAVASARRAGTTASVDVLDKYFTIAQMPVVSSTYWNMVHGNTPEEVRQDAEGMQTMRNLARNLLWMVQCIQAGKAAGLQPPQAESEARTNFIR